MIVSSADLENPDLANVVGPRFETYRARWSRLLEKRGRLKSPWLTPFSWNWAAFVFGMWWLFYRRMHGYGIAMVLLWLTFLVIAAADPKQLPTFYLMSGGINVALGRSANAMYLFYAVRKAKKVSATGEENSAEKRRLKSTSWVAVVISASVQMVVSATVFSKIDSEAISPNVSREASDRSGADATRGYRHISYIDLKLDLTELVGSKVEFFARVAVVGDQVMLLDPHKTLDTNPVFATIEQLSRDDRRLLLSRCAEGCLLNLQGAVRKNGILGESVQLHKLQP